MGRVAAKVEVTSSCSFLFIFLFPEFHRYYSNKSWPKLSPLCFHSGTVTVTNVDKMLILEMRADQKQNLLMFLLLLVVYFLLYYTFQSLAVFLSVYLDFISMMPIEPPGNN